MINLKKSIIQSYISYFLFKIVSDKIFRFQNFSGNFLVLMTTSLSAEDANMTSYDRFYLNTAERRIRNRSLSSLLWTPPLYPGYSSKLSKSLKSSFYQQTWKSTVSEITTLSSNSQSPNSTPNANFYSSSTQNVVEPTCQFKVCVK